MSVSGDYIKVMQGGDALYRELERQLQEKEDQYIFPAFIIGSCVLLAGVIVIFCLIGGA